MVGRSFAAAITFDTNLKYGNNIVDRNNKAYSVIGIIKGNF